MVSVFDRVREAHGLGFFIHADRVSKGRRVKMLSGQPSLRQPKKLLKSAMFSAGWSRTLTVHFYY